MPETNNQNQGRDLAESASAGLADKIVIHTMPKRYLGSARPTPGGHRLSGILIMLFGSLILAGLFAAAYYFLLKKPLPIISEEIDTPVALQEAGEPKPEISRPPAVETPVVVNDSGQSDASAESDPDPEDYDYDEYDDYDDYDEYDIDDESEQETEVVSEEPIRTIEAIAEPSPATSPDSDGDGLSDAEEAILGTNPYSADTDGDSYKDLDELLSLYDPAGPGHIISNKNIQKYSNPVYGYVLYYPMMWQPNSDTGHESVVFPIGGQQFMQIIAMEAAADIDLGAWYMEKFETDHVKNELWADKKGWQALKTEDGLTYYLRKEGDPAVFALSYNPGEAETKIYGNIFDMMVISFEMSN